MKKLIFSVSLLLSCVAYSQTTERYDVYQGDFSVMKSIKDKDTFTYFVYKFQNMKYQHISDLGIILMDKKQDIIDFSENLKKFAESEAGKSINFHHKYFDLNLYDFSKNVYIADSKGKYTSLTQKKAKKLAEEIDSQLNLFK